MVVDEDQVCVDVDECSATSETDICQNGRCINQSPGYSCICNPGYIPSRDQKTCLDTRQGFCYANIDSNGRCRWEFSTPFMSTYGSIFL